MEQELISAIGLVFPRVQCQVSSLQDMLYNSRDEEAVEEVGCFHGKNWWDVKCNLWASHWSALGFFSPEAFAYYLPSLLLCSVNNTQACELASSSLVFNIAHLFDIEERQDLLGELSLSQLQVLREWCKWLQGCPRETASATNIADACDTLDLLCEGGLE